MKDRYASDLSDRQWALMEPLFPRAGNSSKWEKLELVDAVLYFVDNGCKWRNLSHDCGQFLLCRNPMRILGENPLRIAALVERVRTVAGRNASPNYAIIDSQSVKTASPAEERKIDRGKKQKSANGTS